jgi:hypothetical protein
VAEEKPETKMSSREKFWLTIMLVVFGMAHAYGASVMAQASQTERANPALIAHLGD